MIFDPYQHLLMFVFLLVLWTLEINEVIFYVKSCYISINILSLRQPRKVGRADITVCTLEERKLRTSRRVISDPRVHNGRVGSTIIEPRHFGLLGNSRFYLDQVVTGSSRDKGF